LGRLPQTKTNGQQSKGASITVLKLTIANGGTDFKKTRPLMRAWNETLQAYTQQLEDAVEDVMMPY
jgi:hypothetical protein